MATVQQSKQMQADSDVIACLAKAIAALREENLRLRADSEKQEQQAKFLTKRVAKLEALLGDAAVCNDENDQDGDEHEDSEEVSTTDASESSGSQPQSPVVAPTANPKQTRRLQEEDVFGAAKSKKKDRKGNKAAMLLRQVIALQLQSNNTSRKPIAVRPRAHINQPAMRSFQPGRKN